MLLRSNVRSSQGPPVKQVADRFIVDHGAGLAYRPIDRGGVPLDSQGRHGPDPRGVSKTVQLVEKSVRRAGNWAPGVQSPDAGFGWVGAGIGGET